VFNVFTEHDRDKTFHFVLNYCFSWGDDWSILSESMRGQHRDCRYLWLCKNQSK